MIGTTVKEDCVGVPADGGITESWGRRKAEDMDDV